MPANRIKIDPALLRRYEKQAQKRKPRQIVCKILIVCEGTKTEPNYFKAFKMFNRGTFVYEIEIEGEGKNTIQVVDRAIELRDNAKYIGNEYDRVWTVFDRDSFPAEKFNGAIIKAKEHGIECAWSNEAFELWYLYHFHNRVTAMNREEYKKAISEAVNKSSKYKSKKIYKYAKNEMDNYCIMTKFGSQEKAIKWAEAKSQEYTDQCYSEQNPCTMVFSLVRQLIGKDDKLNEELSNKI